MRFRVAVVVAVAYAVPMIACDPSPANEEASGSRLPSPRSPGERAIELANSDAPVLAHENLAVDVTPLTGSVFSASTRFARLSEIVVAGERLWVADRQGSPFFHVLDTASGMVIRSLGRKGEGPGEFIDVVAMSVADHATSSILAYDWRELRLTVLDPTTLSSPEAEAIRIIQLNLPPMQAIWYYAFGHGRILAFSREPTTGLGILDAEGRPVGKQPYRYPGDSTIPARAWDEAVNGAGVCIRPDGEGFAVPYPSAGRISLYDRDARLVGNVRAPYPTEERFAHDPARGGIAHLPHRVYYGDCTFSDRELFALFNGHLRSRTHGHAAPGSRFVHVFDLEGNLRRVFELDRPPSSIAVNRTGTTLFTGSFEDAMVYRYRIPGIER